MSTHVPGCQSLFRVFLLHNFLLAKLATRSIRVSSRKDENNILSLFLLCQIMSVINGAATKLVE